MRRLAAWLHANPNARIQDVAYSTTARKVHHPIRFALAATTLQEAVSKLEAEIQRASSTKKSVPPPVVFVFTGQGSHYAGMGSELYRTSPVFRKTADLCAAICASHQFPPFLDIITTRRRRHVHQERRAGPARRRHARDCPHGLLAIRQALSPPWSLATVWASMPRCTQRGLLSDRHAVPRRPACPSAPGAMRAQLMCHALGVSVSSHSARPPRPSWGLILRSGMYQQSQRHRHQRDRRGPGTYPNKHDHPGRQYAHQDALYAICVPLLPDGHHLAGL